jgi:hypothetical protein
MAAAGVPPDRIHLALHIHDEQQLVQSQNLSFHIHNHKELLVFKWQLRRFHACHSRRCSMQGTRDRILEVLSHEPAVSAGDEQ